MLPVLNLKRRFILFTCFLLGFHCIHAQTIYKEIDGKPSYTETTSFIKNSFDSRLFGREGVNIYKETWAINSYDFWINKFEFSDCELKINFTTGFYRILKSNGEKVDQESEFFETRIQLPIVDRISFIQYPPDQKDENPFYALYFHTKYDKDGPIPENKLIPFGFMNRNQIIENTQIYKALNHLRKLCGAPEPISF